MQQSELKILALIGSPRTQGNTDIMADEVLAGAAAAGAIPSKIYLDDYCIRPIAEVADNSSLRDDPRSDDDFPALLEQFAAADIVIWSSPVYWIGLTGQIKCFLDRLSSYFNHPDYKDHFTGKGHVVICAFGQPDPTHGQWVTEPMKLTVKFLRGVYLGDVCASVYKKGKVREMPEILTACRDLGAEAVKLMREK